LDHRAAGLDSSFAELDNSGFAAALDNGFADSTAAALPP
jgi:hypothetical protein